MSGSGCSIKGDYNNITGANCHVTGDYNNRGSGGSVFSNVSVRNSSVGRRLVQSMSIVGGRVIIDTASHSAVSHSAIAPVHPIVSTEFVNVPEGKDEELPELAYAAPSCIVCTVNKIQTVIVDCGHSCLCFGCAGILGRGKRVDEKPPCPKCRKPFTRVIQIFTES